MRLNPTRVKPTKTLSETPRLLNNSTHMPLISLFLSIFQRKNFQASQWRLSSSSSFLFLISAMSHVSDMVPFSPSNVGRRALTPDTSSCKSWSWQWHNMAPKSSHKKCLEHNGVYCTKSWQEKRWKSFFDWCCGLN